MATIRPNDHAPSEEVKYVLPSATFDLASDGVYTTDDRRVLSDAEVHPWLEVEYPPADELSQTRESRSVPYEEDALSAVNSVAFDTDEVAKARLEENDTEPTAIESGLDQGEEAESGDGRVATSLASVEDVAAEAAPEPVTTPTPSWTQSSDATPQEG